MPINLSATPIAREAPSDTISSNTQLHSSKQRSKLSSTLPPLIFGTATLNYQFNLDPYALHPNTLISTALSSGIRAFDTSPYYGPAEEILGTALHSTEVTSNPSLQSLQRSDYHILTKAGRIHGNEFDYSPAWIRHSVARSLRRLKTTYLDVVYLHDVEFVSPAEVLGAITTLREIRDTNHSIRYVGICGYPVHILSSLSEMILRETGEPLDIVQSYANYTLQNTRLQTEGLARLVRAGVDVVANASPLGMGLLRGQGVPVGAMGNWHPAPDGLREACLRAAEYVVERHGERLETVAVRYAMENWMGVGVDVGSTGPIPSEAIQSLGTTDTNNNAPNTTRPKLGVNVMGVSKLSELSDTMTVYNSIISALKIHPGITATAAATTPTSTPTPTLTEPKPKPNPNSNTSTNQIATELIAILGPWQNHAWSSPDPGFVNQRTVFGVSDAEREAFERMDAAGTTVVMGKGLENSVSVGVGVNDVDGEKGSVVEVGVEETGREMTPSR